MTAALHSNVRAPRHIELVGCLLFALAACGSGERAPGGSGGERITEMESTESTEASEASGGVAAPRRVPGYFDAEGAPHPLACQQDADCAYGGVLADDGCCWSFRDANAAPMSTAYRDWGMARRTACQDECPPPPVPTQPPRCLFEVRCEAGACVNDCP